MLKSRDTNLLDSEKKTLHSFFILYTIFSLTIIIFSFIIYFNTQKELILEKQNSKLKKYSTKLIKDLEYMHNNFYDGIKYPRYKEFKSAIFDSSEKLIFSTLDTDKVNLNLTLYKEGCRIFYVRLLNSFYLGAMYVVIEIRDDSWDILMVKSITYGLILFLMLIIVGYFLLRLLLRPMRDMLYLLNRFIKDTTHELNTPVSTILTNIEMIDKSQVGDKNIKKIDRIMVAAKTISNIYEDLTYVTLCNNTINKDENIDIKKLLLERGEFFKTIADSKRLSIEYDLQPSFLVIDKNKITRVIDNLLSNAIKYNKRGGEIKISSKSNSFCIEDSGIGIDKENLHKIFNRYERFNDSEGGFGLGLNIVYEIIKEYDLKIKFISKLNKGTKVIIKW